MSGRACVDVAILSKKQVACLHNQGSARFPSYSLLTSHSIILPATVCKTQNAYLGK